MLTSSHRFVERDGVRLRVFDQGDRGQADQAGSDQAGSDQAGSDQAVVVLAHGYPELAYSWRHQIPALAAAGYRVLAPDQRGYGGSDRPAAVEAYDIFALTSDLVGLLDDVGAERASFIGHDWGAMLVWHTALLHPDRVAAVAGLSVPPIPRARTRPTERWLEKFGPDFYMLRYQEPGLADAELAADVTATMRDMFAEGRGAGLPAWLSPEEFDVYVEEFSRTGFTGALNWYRNYDRNWAGTGHLVDARITAPALFVGGTDDPVRGTMRPERAAEVVAGPYQELWLPGAGHWLQQERPAEINRILLDFLGAR